MAVAFQTAEDRLRDQLADAPVRRGPAFWSWSFPAMGTWNEILFRPGDPGRGIAFHQAAREWLAWFEARYSRFIETSLVQRINRAAGGEWTPLAPEDEELFALCDWYHWRTGGAFDPTTGALLKHWDYHLKDARLPTDAEVAAARARTGWQRVERQSGALRLSEPGMRIDLGGIGKEYAVDRISEFAERHQISDYMISLGRDIRCGGSPPGGNSWRIGLEHPERPDHCWGGVGLRNGAIASSGNSRRCLRIGDQTYGHLLDVRSGRPAETDVLAAWAIAPTCTEAGVLASAAVILGGDDGLIQFECSPHTAGCLWAPGQILQTRRFTHYALEDP